MAHVKTPVWHEVVRHFPSLTEALRRVYGDRLVAAVVFGSGARGDLSLSSDLDLLVVLDPCEPDHRARLSFFWERVGEVLEGRFPIPLSPLILSVEEAQTFHPLWLDIVEAHRVLYDAGGVIARMEQQVQAYLREGKVEAHCLGGRRYWRIRP